MRFEIQFGMNPSLTRLAFSSPRLGVSAFISSSADQSHSPAVTGCMLSTACGANPRRSVFSVIVRCTMNAGR